MDAAIANWRLRLNVPTISFDEVQPNSSTSQGDGRLFKSGLNITASHSSSDCNHQSQPNSFWKCDSIQLMEDEFHSSVKQHAQNAVSVPNP